MARRNSPEPNNDRTVRASISFTEAQYLVLERLAAENRVSVAWVVRDAVSAYIDRKWPLLAEVENEKI